jgi:hypothetical protein
MCFNNENYITNQIAKYVCVELGGAELICVIINAKTWIHSNNATGVLQYTSAERALQDYFDDEYQQTYQDLPLVVVSASATNVVCIIVFGVRALAHGSEIRETLAFSQWFNREVMRKKTYYHWRNDHELGETEEERLNQLGYSPKEEKMSYVIKYPQATVIAGNGEHQQTNHALIDSCLKSYEGGCPDLQITLPLPNGFRYVVAFESMHSYGTETFFDH